MDKLKEFQEIIGYTFSDEALLRQALTHSSYANEQGLKQLKDNERLEFLGDAVLEIVCSEFLFCKYQDYNEGSLSRTRASIVCEQTLAFCCRDISLGDYLYLGKGEAMTGGASRPSVLSDAFEAVIGALYLDGGMDAARVFINKYVLNDIEHMQLFYDSKTLLQEYVQGKDIGDLEYRLISEDGPDHNKSFSVQAVIGGVSYGTGSGHSKKSAEQMAAYHTLLMIRQYREARQQADAGERTGV